MNHCSGKTKAIITVYNDDNSIDERLVSRHPPINTQCKSLYGRIVSLYTVHIYFSYFDTVEGIRKISSVGWQLWEPDMLRIITNISPGDAEYKCTITASIRSLGQSNYFNRVPPTYFFLTRDTYTSEVDFNRNWIDFALTGRLEAEFLESRVDDRNHPSLLNNFEFSITDATGTIFSKVYSNCPSYRVACDDECPFGYKKIPTVEYPGYKCREKCPPETCCECDCGDVICCYGNQGQVLKTIPK